MTRRKRGSLQIKDKSEVEGPVIYKRLKLSGLSEPHELEPFIDPIECGQEDITRGNNQEQTSKKRSKLPIFESTSEELEPEQCSGENNCSQENTSGESDPDVEENGSIIVHGNVTDKEVEDDSDIEVLDDSDSEDSDSCDGNSPEMDRVFQLISSVGREGNKYFLDHYHSDVIVRFPPSIDEVIFPSSLDFEFSPDLCFICNEDISDDSVRCWECDEISCHKECVENIKFGSYTSFHALLDGPEFEGKVHCPRHFCVKCFAMRLHNRAYQCRSLIRCRLCASSYHSCCIPAGCVIDEESSTIVCPRHLIVNTFPHRPTGYCVVCNENEKADLIQCTNCCRSFHQKCNKALAYDPDNKIDQRCEDCVSHNFAVVGDRVYAQFGTHQFYPAVVVPNEDYPKDDVITPGNLVVKWISNGNASFSIVNHYSVIACTEDTFFLNFTHISNLPGHLDFYNEAVKDENKIPPPLTSKYATSRNREVKIVRKLVPSELVKKALNEMKFQNQRNGKKSKDVGFDSCSCPLDNPKRCTTEDCDNRVMGLECPTDCGKGAGCGNRLSSHRYKELKVDKTANRGFGLFTTVEIEKESYIGEYCGELITTEEYEIRNHQEKMWQSRDKGFYMFKNGSFFIDADVQGGILRYANHSCDPNCVMRALTDSTGLKHICMYAKRKIEVGEELTFDYCGSSKHQTSNAVTYDCYCGSNNCKGEFTV